MNISQNESLGSPVSIIFFSSKWIDKMEMNWRNYIFDYVHENVLYLFLYINGPESIAIRMSVLII